MPLRFLYLLDRLVLEKSRADELAGLRKRLDACPNPSRLSRQEAELALELRALRPRILAALGEVEVCKRCARRHPYPHGRWPGGHCCGGVTTHLFTDDEIASLHAAGTTAGALRAPRGDHAGCSFRGPQGCSLRAEDRPNLCVRYSCRDLREELRQRGDLAEIDQRCDRLLLLFTRFVDARERRRADELFGELLGGRG